MDSQILENHSQHLGKQHQRNSKVPLEFFADILNVRKKLLLVDGFFHNSGSVNFQDEFVA